MDKPFNLTQYIESRQLGRLSNKKFQNLIISHNLLNFGLNKYLSVKTVGQGVITSLDVDPLEYRYILSGTSDGLVAIYDIQNSTGEPKFQAEIVGLTSSNTPSKTKFWISRLKLLKFD